MSNFKRKMIGRQKGDVIGKCKVCGEIGKLTFEHVPPKNAFNKGSYYAAQIDDLTAVKEMQLFSFDGEQVDKAFLGKKHQGGIGYYSLCERCNNTTGRKYAKYYIEWVMQNMSILQKTNGRPSLVYPTYFYPLRVIKQIVTMFFSVMTDFTQQYESELVRFVLNQEIRNLSERYKIYCYYNLKGQPRYMGDNFIGNVGGKTIHAHEITFPPFGFVMTFDSPKPDERLKDITSFAAFSYSQRCEFYGNFHTLPTHLSNIPLDYRPKEVIQTAILNSMLDE